jgi:hypothetical protein
MILWVDDIRNPPRDLVDCDVARTYHEALALLRANAYNAIYLDHDLASFDGDGRERTGYDLVLQIVQMKLDGLPVPKTYHLLTANPVGRENMAAVIARYL